MFAAIQSKANNYCLEEFKASVAEFCTRNGYHNLHFKNPNRRQIDFMAAGFGNFTPQTAETAQSQPDGFTRTPSGAAILTQDVPSTPDSANPPSHPISSSLNGSFTVSLPSPPNPPSPSNPPSPAVAADPSPSSQDTLPDIRNNHSVSVQSSLNSSRASSTSSSDSDDSLTTPSRTHIRIQPQEVSPNLSPIPKSQEDLFKESQACASTPIRSSQDLNLMVSPSQQPARKKASSSQNSVREKVSDFEREPSINSTPNTSTVARAKNLLRGGILITRTKTGCTKDAILYKKESGDMVDCYTLHRAVTANEIRITCTNTSVLFKKLVPNILDKTMGKLSYPISWSANSPPWQ